MTYSTELSRWVMLILTVSGFVFGVAIIPATSYAQTSVDDTTDAVSERSDMQFNSHNTTLPGKTPPAKLSSGVARQVASVEDEPTGVGTAAGITQSVEENTEIQLTVAPDATQSVQQTITNAGGNVRVAFDDGIVAAVPPDAIKRLRDMEVVKRIQLPETGSTTEITSGTETLNADTVQNSGITGENVSIAVIDTNFNANNPAIAENVIQTKNIQSGEQFNNISDGHGTATADVITDTAPNVSLILISTPDITETGVESALRFADQNTSADVITMSLSFPTGPFDGSSKMGELITDTTQNGTPVFVSAGNYADKNHLNTSFTDGDNNGIHNFSSSSEQLTINTSVLEKSDSLGIFVSWNDYAFSGTNDFNLTLRNKTGAVVQVSENRQPNFSSTERIDLSNPTDGSYTLSITGDPENDPVTFNIFTLESELTQSTTQQSVARPAVAKKSLAVGAVSAQDRNLRSYSSRGPTVDGRQKPDLVAPDGVSTGLEDTPFETYFGTSASAPHAAGVAALIFEEQNSLTATQLTSALTDTANTQSIDETPTEPNNQTGAGLIDAASVVADVDSNIETCRVINSSGVVTLGSDIQSQDQSTCLRIETDDVTLDGNNRVIEYNSSPSLGSGIRVKESANNITIRNITVEKFGNNIDVSGAEDILLRNITTVNASIRNGISVSNTQNIQIKDVSSNNNIDYGIRASEVSNITVSNSSTKSSTQGNIRFDDVTNATIANASAVNSASGSGIYLNTSRIIEISDTVASGNGDAGVSLVGTKSTTLQNISLINNTDGVVFNQYTSSDLSRVVNSTGNKLINSSISESEDESINLVDSQDTVIKDNQMSGARIRVFSTDSDLTGNSVINISVLDNSITDTSSGIRIQDSFRTSDGTSNDVRGIRLQNNTVTAAESGLTSDGVTLRDVTNITLRNNSISGFEENLAIEETQIDSADHSVEYFRHDIDTSNTVNGDPVYYRRNVSDRTITADTNAGFVGIVDSKNVTIRGLTLSNVAPGVLLVGSQNVTVQNISTENTSRGIKGISLDNSRVVDSAFLSSNSDDYAVSLARSSNNTIQNNSFTQTKVGSTGIEVWNDSDENLIANNTLQYDSSLSQTSFSGFRIGQRSDTNQIVSNTLTGAPVRVTGAFSKTITPQRNSIERNVIQNSPDDGIDDDGNATLIRSNQLINTTTEFDDEAISGGSYATVRNNTVNQTDGSGIETAEFATVTKNRITNASDGIVFEGKRSVARNNTIIDITEYGISIEGSNVTIVDNRIRNVTASSNSVGIADATRSDAKGSSIQTNNIIGATYGLRLAGNGTFGQITRNYVTNSSVAVRVISEDDADEGASNYTITDTAVRNPHISAYRNTPRFSENPASTGTIVSNLTLSNSSLSFTERAAAIGPAIQPAIAPAGTRPLDIYLNITNTTSTNPAYVDLTLNYTRANLSDVNESAIELYRYTDTGAGASWTAVSTSKDAQANTVSKNISTVGIYSLFEENASVEQRFTPLSGTTEVGNTTTELSGDLRVEDNVESDTAARLVEQTAKNYTLEMGVSESVSNITFYLNRSEVESNIGNLSNVSLLIADTEQSFITRSPADRRWIGFELQQPQSQPQSQNQTVTFVNTTTELATVKSVSAQTGNGTLRTQINTTGTLTEVQLNVSNSTGTVQTLSRSSFTESTPNSGENLTYTNTTAIADGSYNVSLFRAVDETGINISTGQTRRVTVTSSPAITIVSASVREQTNPDENVTAGDTIRVNATVQGATTVTANTSAFGPPSNITMIEQSENNYTTNVTVNSSATEGSSQVAITASNARNNDSRLTESLTVDTTPPAINSIQLVNNNGSISSAAPGDNISINVSATDDFSTVQSVSANATSLGAGTVSLTDSSENSFYTGQFGINSLTVSDSGTRSVRVRATDTVGLSTNESEALTLNVSQDREPPTLRNTSIFETNSFDSRVNGSDQVRLEAEVSDPGNASLSSISINLSEFGLDETQLTDTDDDGVFTTTFNIDATAVSDGSEQPTITAVDSAGNKNTSTTQTALIIDTAEPVIKLDTNQSNIQVGDTVRFNATETIPRGPGSPTVETLQWDFDDDGQTEVTGSLDNVSVINRTFNSPGDITTTLTATDRAGNANTTTVNTTVVKQAPPTTDLQIKHSEFVSGGGRVGGSPAFFASDLTIEPVSAENITFGAGVNRSLVVENSSGSSVIIKPADNATTTIRNDFLIVDIYDERGNIRDINSPRVASRGERVDVEVTGDTEMFAAGVATAPDEQSDPFDSYEIGLRENGSLIDSTGERLLGIGYNAGRGIQQNSTTGDIEVTIPRSNLNEYSEVTSGLVAEFVVQNKSFNIALRQNVTTANEGDIFSFTIDASEIAPSEIGDPDSESRTNVSSASLILYDAKTLPEVSGLDDDRVISIFEVNEFQIDPEPTAGQEPDQPTASVTFANRTISSGSTSVTVANAAFNGSEQFNLVVHEATDVNGDEVIQAGEIETKIGESVTFDSGTRENIAVDISDEVATNDTVSQLDENQTLVAMLHTTNTSDEDSNAHAAPITRNGTPVFDQATVTVQQQTPPTAAVQFDNQTVLNGSTSVSVATATFDGNEEFNLVVHEATDNNNDGTIQADEIGTKIGESVALDNGTATDISVDISNQVAHTDDVAQLTKSQTLVAMLHTTNTSDGDSAVHTAPIMRNGTPVFDQADVTVKKAPITTIQFEDQTVLNGSTTVTVESAQFGNDSVRGKDFVVVVHETDDGDIGTKIGESAVIVGNQTQSNVTVNLSREIPPNDDIARVTESQELIAMLHLADTDDNDGDINHGSNNLSADTPTPVTDRAQVGPLGLQTVNLNQTSLNQPGQPVEITATVKNEGATDNSTQLTLLRDRDGDSNGNGNGDSSDQQLATATVGVDSGATRTASFTVTPTRTETFSVQGPASIQNVTIDVAELTLANATLVTQQPVTTTDTVVVNATVTNSGTATGVIPLTLRQNGISENSTTKEIPAGETVTAQLQTSLSEGTRNLTVNSSLTTQSVTVGEFVVAPSAAITNATVRVGSGSVGPGGTTELNLILEKAPQGLAGYNLTASVGAGVADSDVDVRVVNATAPSIFNNSVTETTIGQDNQSVEIRAADINTTVEANEINISLGTVTVAANEKVNVSQTELTVSVSRISDNRGTPINVTAQNGTVNVTKQPPLAEDLNPPTDIDEDGVLEDINGNGRLDFNDVVALFENLQDAEVQFQDVNGNGRIDFDDIVELFEEI